MNFILDNLAIGNFKEALTPAPQIDALLCVAEERDVENCPFLYKKVPMVDMHPIPPTQLAEAVEWIKDNISHKKIMVFCNAGVGRSPSTVVAYLCCFHQMGFGEAVEFVARRKADISTLPNLILTIEEVREMLSPPL
ncbi:dual specificity protein phosphatase family protein [Candidatus Riflebacteria bacterium]